MLSHFIITVYCLGCCCCCIVYNYIKKRGMTERQNIKTKKKYSVVKGQKLKRKKKNLCELSTSNFYE